MSYARFTDECDVYVFSTIQPSTGMSIYECCGCLLEDVDDPPFFWCYTAQEMIDHLLKHRSNGHKIPEHVLDNLRQEIK